MASRTNAHTAEVSDDWHADLWRKIYRVLVWLLFVWACLWLPVMVHFFIRFVTESGNPLHHELGIGFGMGGCYGLPAWLGIPLISWTIRSRLSKPVLFLVNAPVAIAAILTILLIFSGAAYSADVSP